MMQVHDPLGYGAYHYNVEDYGDARSQSGLPLRSGHFSFDNWGEHLIFCFSGDGKIYKWRPNSAVDSRYHSHSRNQRTHRMSSNYCNQ